MIAAASQAVSFPVPGRPQIIFSNVSLDLGGKAILENISLDVKPGEFLCIIGASGCGKTTALRLAAGLYQPTSGTVTFDGKPMLMPRRDIAIVFQDYGKALLPWRTAAGNVSLALEATGIAPSQRAVRIDELLKKVGLPNHAGKYPAEMSGGMQQRLQIARCLAQEPKALLMDEPFGALDAMTRESMNMELMRVWSEERKTVIFITHSIPEAVLLGDRVVVMSPRPGRISEVVDVNIDRPRDLKTMGTPRFGELCDRIRTIFGAEAPMVSSL